MFRTPPYWFLILILLGFGLSGCVVVVADDDDTAVQDDDDDDDDDDVDECLEPTDITSNVAGDNVVGSTVNSDNGFVGSCSNGSIADDLLVFTAPASATYAVSTDHEITSFDTLIFAFTDCYDSGNTELACNDDVATGTNSEILFDATEGQDIYIAVEGYEGVGAYEISVYPAVCGDGILVSIEGCDDGNTDDGDGCDSLCQWECDAEDANEEDDTLDEATELTGTTSIPDLFLCTTDTSEQFEGVYLDIFSVDVAEGEFVSAALLPGGAAADCSGMTAAITVMNADGDNVGENRGTEEAGACPAAVAEPGAGTYFVAVFGNDPHAAPQAYGLSVVVATSVCGDALQEGIEECDDGNMVGGDGCSSACVLEDDACTVNSDITDNLASGAAINGDSSVGVDEHTPSADCTAPGSSDVTYTFTAASDGAVIVSTDHPGTGYDTALHVREECLDPGTQIACNDDKDYDNQNYNAELFFTAVEGESYSIIVDGWNGESGPFELVLSQPTCGNGEVELSEDCDDGNTVAGDGCEDDCTPTPVCAISAADEDAGLLAAGSTTDVTLTVDDSADFGGLSCSGTPSGNGAVAFSLDAPATVEISYGAVQPTDVQVQLFANDASCTPMSECSDPYPDAGTSFTSTLAAGDYLLAVETWDVGTGGDVQISIAVQ
jgi:cysteine-rich repeat protein